MKTHIFYILVLFGAAMVARAQEVEIVGTFVAVSDAYGFGEGDYSSLGTGGRDECTTAVEEAEAQAAGHTGGKSFVDSFGNRWRHVSCDERNALARKLPRPQGETWVFVQTRDTTLGVRCPVRWVQWCWTLREGTPIVVHARIDSIGFDGDLARGSLLIGLSIRRAH